MKSPEKIEVAGVNVQDIVAGSPEQRTALPVLFLFPTTSSPQTMEVFPHSRHGCLRCRWRNRVRVYGVPALDGLVQSHGRWPPSACFRVAVTD
ncbi:hypothetical protein DM860_000967 [Cuscuta australis]|uniref:Uncharacterized protein n=1 Tax=Cuscuta australis TaxID=267555 RepID=A0A328DSG3_9ASTE|nr:hypothetical protein DM860_000967 [Cuscuta australis]